MRVSPDEDSDFQLINLIRSPMIAALFLFFCTVGYAQETEIDVATRVCLTASPDDSNCECGGVIRCANGGLVIALNFDLGSGSVSGTISSEIGLLTNLNEIAARSDSGGNCAFPFNILQTIGLTTQAQCTAQFRPRLLV